MAQNKYLKLPPLHLLRSFESAARLGSFKRAANELHITPPAITQHIKQLEQTLGKALFLRLNPGVRLTDVGREYYRTVEQGLSALVCFPVHQNKPAAQRITLSAPPFLVQQHLLPNLYHLQLLVPNLDVDIAAENRIADLHAGEADVAIRFGLGDWPGLTAVSLIPLVVTPVCSRRYAEQHKLTQLEQLPEQTLLHLNISTRGWHYWLQQQDVRLPDSTRGMQFNDYNAMMSACQNHAGVALGLRPSVDVLLASGDLVAPIDVQLVMQEQYYFVTADGRQQDPVIQTLLRWVKTHLPQLDSISSS